MEFLQNPPVTNLIESGATVCVCYISGSSIKFFCRGLNAETSTPRPRSSPGLGLIKEAVRGVSI